MLSFFILSVLTVGTLAQRQCTTPDRQPGSCIYLEQCSNLYNLIQSQQFSQSEIQFLRQSQCGRMGGRILVCCSKGAQAASSPTQQRPSYNQQGTGNNLLPAPGVCGKGAANRIFGGNITDIGEFPWMALLGYSNNGKTEGFHCGGSLINNRYVITAAHCIKGTAIPKNWIINRVRLGEWDTSTPEDCKVYEDGYRDCSDPPIDVPVELHIVHENYEPRSPSQYHDIALLRLSRPVQYTHFISPICLPSNSRLRSSPFEGFSFDVSGWGKTEFESKSNIKLKAAIDTVDLRTCDSYYQKNQVALRDKQICAGGEQGIDSCNGDSGGPLIGVDHGNKKNPNYFLAGLVSFGTKSCGIGWPGVYTRVGGYIDWIQRNIAP